MHKIIKIERSENLRPVEAASKILSSERGGGRWKGYLGATIIVGGVSLTLAATATSIYGVKELLESLPETANLVQPVKDMMKLGMGFWTIGTGIAASVYLGFMAEKAAFSRGS